MHLYQIDKWFENYDKWVNQVQRANRLGLVWSQEDKILGTTYYTLEQLDLKAEEMKVLLKKEKERYLKSMKERQNKNIKKNY